MCSCPLGLLAQFLLRVNVKQKVNITLVGWMEKHLVTKISVCKFWKQNNHTHMHIHVYTCTHMNVHTHVHMCICTHIHKHVHTHAHICTQTPMHIHKHTVYVWCAILVMFKVLGLYFKTWADSFHLHFFSFSFIICHSLSANWIFSMKNVNKLSVLVHAFNPSTGKTGSGESLSSEASLVYRMNSRTAKST